MVAKTEKKTAESISPKQTSTEEWTLVDALKKLDDIYKSGNMKALVNETEKTVAVLGTTKRIVRKLYDNGYSIEKIIDIVGTDRLADLGIILVLEPHFETNWYLR
ncbi:hypothetical protein R80B4_01729 [Fibrobacteres bacterium R8-0-B4]